MGLKRSALVVLAGQISGSVLSLGYPDILASAEDVERILRVRPTVFTEHGAWHGVKHPLPETVHVFALLGAELKCIDVHASRGVETFADLNQPCDLGSHDLVLDCGTTEHCFNIGQAILNAASAVKPGGRIFHSPPASMFNHGFYNLCPTLFHDLYSQNGWEVEDVLLEKGDELYQAPRTARCTVPSEYSLYVLAKRITDAPINYPTQSKYLKNPDL